MRRPEIFAAARRDRGSSPPAPCSKFDAWIAHAHVSKYIIPFMERLASELAVERSTPGRQLRRA